MNSLAMDHLLNAATATLPNSGPRRASEADPKPFDQHLRQAASDKISGANNERSAANSTVKPQQEQSTDHPRTQEQASAGSSEDQSSLPQEEASRETVERTAESQEPVESAEQPVDEVILAAANQLLPQANPDSSVPIESILPSGQATVSGEAPDQQKGENLSLPNPARKPQKETSSSTGTGPLESPGPSETLHLSLATPVEVAASAPETAPAIDEVLASVRTGDLELVGTEQPLPANPAVAAQGSNTANHSPTKATKSSSTDPHASVEAAEASPGTRSISAPLQTSRPAAEPHSTSSDHGEPQSGVEQGDLQRPEVFGEQLRSQLENETLEGSKSTRDSNVTPENAASRQTNDVSALTGEGIGRSEATRAVTLADPQKDVPVPTTDRARFVQRVANAFRSAQQQDGEIQLRLSPPELGSLKIEIAIRNGVLTANLETETSDARRVLLDNLPALRQRLAEQDIRIEKFEVDVRREGHSDHGQPEAEDRQSPRENRNSPTRRPEGPLETVVGSRRLPASAMSVPASGLDVRI